MFNTPTAASPVTGEFPTKSQTQKGNPNLRTRVQDGIEMVREETLRSGKKIVIRAKMPVGRGWNAGHGIIDYKNMNVGWMSADEYDAKKHAAEVAARRDEEAKEEKAKVKDKK